MIDIQYYFFINQNTKQLPAYTAGEGKTYLNAMSSDYSTQGTLEFNFLDEKSKKEPNIIDVLSEIYLLQSQSLPEGEGPLVTLEHLQNSRNIRIPFTTARNRNIEYLLEHLTRNYPETVKTITTFDFNVDGETKKLDVKETIEYTVMLSESAFETLRKVREKRSLENLLSFISKYRIINLSKVLKKANNKNALSTIIKLELGKSVFTFKSYRQDKNRIEYAEDYCFHANNYEKVKSSLNFKKLQEIISAYEDLMMRRLKKYGILSADTGDYRDKKLEYILHVLLDDLNTTLSDGDLIEVKNFKSLRSCLLKVDTILDPTLTLGGDIAKLTRENAIVKKTEVLFALPELTDELFEKWMTEENLINNRIIALAEEDDIYLIDGMRFYATISEMADRILYNPAKLNLMAYQERSSLENRFDLYVKAAGQMLASASTAQKVLNALPETLEQLRKIVSDYEGKKVQQFAKKELKKIEKTVQNKTSLLRRILNFFKSIFTAGKEGANASKRVAVQSGRELSPETRRLYDKISERNDPLIPLSDYITLSDSNNAEIDRTIQELRENELKVVVPIYNARELLYPKRSKKVLLPDVEYLMIPPEVCRTPEEIRAFSDSLSGYKIKDDVLSIKSILTIEKYLLTIYRQKRSQVFKKEL